MRPEFSVTPLRVERGMGQNPLLRRIRPHTFIIHDNGYANMYNGSHVFGPTMSKELVTQNRQAMENHNEAHQRGGSGKIQQTNGELPLAFRMEH